VDRLQSRTIRNFAALFLGFVAVFAAAGATDKLTEDPELLLRRIRTRTAAHLSQLPNYTCHQVVDRMMRRGTTWNHIDTVEFEVAFVGRQELFSRPGQERFGEKSLGELAPGTMSDGVLGSQIDMAFATDTTEFRYVGTAKKDGRKTFRYDLSVSQENSGFKVRHGSAEAIVPFEGSVWVDTETLDLVRVDLKVNRIPSYVGVRSIEKSMHYRLMHIADADYLLPRNAELAATDDLGNYNLNRITLDRCRAFTGESMIKYGAPVPAQGSASRDRTDHQDH
jgi:hypothetical protein